METIKDNKGKILGYYDSIGNSGDIILRDPHNAILGTYVLRENRTKDKKNNIVGEGNLLPMLLS